MHFTNYAPNLTIISMKDKNLYECPAAEALEVNLETAGCVFLPAAGYREGTTVSCGPVGRYWSSTSTDSDHYMSDFLWFSTSNGYTGLTVTEGKRYFGYSVRLVYDVN